MAQKTRAGGMTIKVFDWNTGTFKDDMSYLTKIFFGSSDATAVSKSAFKSAVQELRSPPRAP